MKKVWNVWESEQGTETKLKPNSSAEAYYKKDKTWSFLGQVTEEIETPKKEVEREVDVVTQSFNEDCTIRTVSAVIPVNAYDFKLHYKIKE